jgi:hypothetical protein
MSQIASIYETSAKDKIGHFFTFDLGKKLLTAVIKFEDVQTIKKMMNFQRKISRRLQNLCKIFFFFASLTGEIRQRSFLHSIRHC